jgi:hypothetical protein
MFRCEDFPCCGCGSEGCIDFNTIVSCKDCGDNYHPDSNTGVYCYKCQIRAERQDDYEYDY